MVIVQLFIYLIDQNFLARFPQNLQPVLEVPSDLIDEYKKTIN